MKYEDKHQCFLTHRPGQWPAQECWLLWKYIWWLTLGFFLQFIWQNNTSRQSPCSYFESSVTAYHWGLALPVCCLCARWTLARLILSQSTVSFSCLPTDDLTPTVTHTPTSGTAAAHVTLALLFKICSVLESHCSQNLQQAMWWKLVRADTHEARRSTATF